jgi:probable rRNA maturation factor
MLHNPRFQLSPALTRRIGRPLLDRLATQVRRAAQRLRISPARFATLGLRIVDDAEMATLHLEFMGEAGPTDVLSFSPEPEPDGVEAEIGAALGDIVLDWDAVERQARDRSVRARLDEATVLIVHGLAHLHGHDHRTDPQGRAMHALERRLLRGLLTPDPPRPYVKRLVARTTDEEPHEPR